MYYKNPYQITILPTNGSVTTFLFYELEGTAPYAGFTSSSCGGLRPPAEAFYAVLAIFGVQ